MSKFEEFTCQMCGTDCKPSAGTILDIDYEFWCFFCGVEYLQQQNKRYREYLKKITNKSYIHNYCDMYGVYEYQAMEVLANEALEADEG